MKQIRKRLTYANVMSSIAVFLVLGGATAFAAKKIGCERNQGQLDHDRQDQEGSGNRVARSRTTPSPRRRSQTAL